jgi:hypothetical protein
MPSFATAEAAIAAAIAAFIPELITEVRDTTNKILATHQEGTPGDRP